MKGMFDQQFADGEQAVPQPIPIKPAVAAPGQFPIAALSPRLQAAARGMQDLTQAPLAIAAQSVLAAAALAVQPFIDIVLPTGETIPSSLFLVTIAISGERKSANDKLALNAVRRREAEMREEWRKRSADFLADSTAHKEALSKAKKGSDRYAIKEAIERCGPEPIAPPLPMLVSDEGTLQGLQKLFARAMPSLGLFSDEGGMWLGGYAMAEENRGQTGAALSKLWDGAPIKRVRGTDEVEFLAGRRMSMHLMVQPRIANRLFSDVELRDQGLLGRILISNPATHRGARPWRDPSDDSRLDVEKFDARLYTLLTGEMPMDPETRELKPAKIPFSPEARKLWIEWHDTVEASLKPGGDFDEIASFAGKLPEHSARLAAVMAYFEAPRQCAEISASALASGITLAQYYAGEALRAIGVGNADTDSEHADALIRFIRDRGHRVVGTRWLSRNVTPKDIRPAAVLKRAILLLEEMGHLKRIKGGADMVVDGKPTYQREAFTVVEDDAGE